MEFAPAHRALRIRELLEAAPGGSLTVDTMQAIHTDTQLGPWPVFRSILSGLDADDLSGEAKELRSELLGWDAR
ncbi:penicillin acylase family protein, partial [Priestia megaterium]|uniref:penicillin acylase family protein n=1 Tax=Priestia megaterium TaxID=1404 RepID=UPI00352B0DB2